LERQLFVHEDIEKTDKLTGFSIHPSAKGTRLKEKLDYLKKNKLSLYNEHNTNK